MARQRREIRADGTTWCRFHHKWESLADFDWDVKSEIRNGTVSEYRSPKADCRLARQTMRDADKERDPGGAAIIGRAKEHARNVSQALGQTVGYKFVLVELNWDALIPIMRALLGPDGKCLNCRRRQSDARRYHIEHRIPPEHLADWAAHHARNLWLACGGCNCRKGRNDADRAWLEAEHRKWITDRQWADHAGEAGWPAYDAAFGPISEPEPPRSEQLSLLL
jgi:hypothetical protein